MYIAGSYGQLAQLVADGENFAVNIVQILFFPDLLMNFFIGTQHKSIVAVRLNFQIIIKVGDFLQLFVAFAVENSLVQLALLAGGADNNAVPVLFQRRLQDQRTVLKVLNIALGDMLIQYLAPGQGADQKNNMIEVGEEMASISDREVCMCSSTRFSGAVSIFSILVTVANELARSTYSPA